MRDAERYSFSPVRGDDSSLLPLLPLTLRSSTQEVAAAGLLDTGATVNVLPYGLGLQLGAVWEEQAAALKLSGNLANFDARVLVLEGIVGGFAPVRLAFAWTRSEEVPLILGQINFFLEFDVCFYRSRQLVEVRPRAGSGGQVP